jgi:hypothetical protein
MGVCAVANVDMRELEVVEFHAMTHSARDLQLASNDFLFVSDFVIKKQPR